MPKKTDPKRLHFVAIVAPEPVQSRLTAFKHEAKERFGSGHALNAPAHLTLIPPFYATAPQIDDWLPALEELVRREAPFPLELNGFGHFGNRVIFVDVTYPQRLKVFQRRLFELFCAHFPQYRKPNRFHPHLTVAFRDLEPGIFPRAWAHFSAIDYRTSFTADQLSILRHRDRKWHVIQNISLGR